jgi:hypothetical protein
VDYMLQVMLAQAAGGGGVGLPTAGLIAWYKADVGVTKDGSNKVSQWDDQSGNGHHLTQPTALNKPTWQASVLNGLPGIQFPASTGLIYPTTIAGVYSVLAVITYPSATFNNWAYLTTTDRAGYNWWALSGEDFWRETPFSPLGLYRRNGVTQAPGSTISPLNASHYIVGYANTGATWGTPGPGTHTLGNYPDYSRPWGGHIHEWALWSSQLSGPEITQTENYVTGVGRYGASF